MVAGIDDWRRCKMKIVADSGIRFVRECFSSIGEVELVPGLQITPAAVRHADVLIVRTATRVDAGLLSASSVRFAASATTGYDHIDLDFLRKNNIGFACGPGSNANSVAEYVVAAMLEAAEKTNCKLEDKSIGIIGVGNIGGNVAQKAEALGMRVYLNDPPLQRQTGDAKYLPLKELFDCDFITLHTPLTHTGPDKTFHLADEEFFKSLKPGCMFVNTARGGVMDTTALKAAISSDRFKAVVIDVWENEPNIDTQLLEMVDIGTEHIAGYSLDGKLVALIMVYTKACEHFGLEAKLDIESFLPAPDVPELKINPKGVSQQQLLLEVVKKIYDVKEDDSALRQILNKPVEQRARYFETLRQDYYIRREFHTTRIILDSACKSVADKLAGIGFLVE